MGKRTYNRKVARIFVFWILFFVLVGLSVLLEALGIKNKNFDVGGSMFLGVLLTGYYIPPVKGGISRKSYFFGFLVLLLMLEIFRWIFLPQESPSFFRNYLFAIFFSSISYFLYSIVTILVCTVNILVFVKNALGVETIPRFISTSFTYLSLLAGFYPFIFLNVRRLKDLNLSKWFSLIAFIPFIGIIFQIFLCLKGSKKKRVKKQKK